MGLDIVGGEELGKNWLMIRVEQHLEWLLKSEIESRLLCGFNSNNSIMARQYVGTCVRYFYRAAIYSSTRDVDPYGLVR